MDGIFYDQQWVKYHVNNDHKHEEKHTKVRKRKKKKRETTILEIKNTPLLIIY